MTTRPGADIMRPEVVAISSTPRPPALIQATELQHTLCDWPKVDWVAHSPSTNTELLTATKAGQPTPALLGAHWQSGGRGRAGRRFETPPGSALTFSCAFRTHLPPAALPTLSICLGLAAWQALAKRLPEDHALRLKWPNDLQWGKAKLAGILLESTGLRAKQPTGIVIGIGLNLTPGSRLSGPLQREIAGWADTGDLSTPAQLVTQIAQHWQIALQKAERDWQPNLGIATLPQAFAAADALSGQTIQVLDHGIEQAHGLAQGIDPFGRLGLRSGDKTQWLTVGDISIRPRA